MKRLFRTLARELRGPYLLSAETSENCVRKGNKIISTLSTGGINAKLLNESLETDRLKLARLAQGELTDAVVFYTHEKPSMEDGPDGIGGFDGWDKKEIAIQVAFSVSNGKLDPEAPELLKETFPDTYAALNSDLENKV